MARVVQKIGIEINEEVYWNDGEPVTASEMLKIESKYGGQRYTLLNPQMGQPAGTLVDSEDKIRRIWTISAQREQAEKRGLATNRLVSWFRKIAGVR